MKIPRIFKIGRRPAEPNRQTDIYPRLMQVGQVRMGERPAYKPTPRNIRYFSRTPYARRAINAIKNSIAQLSWEIVAKPGAVMSKELERQMEVVYTCFEHPNEDDSFSTFTEQVIEDMMCGAGAAEQEIGGDPSRPLWLWPVDGLSIQIFPFWEGGANEARYAQVLGYGSPGGSYDAIHLRNDQLIYIKPNPTTADPFGFGPLEIAFTTIGRQLGVAEYAGLVSSNAQPSTGLWMGNIDAQTLAAFRSYWRNEIEGQGRMPIFGGGDKSPESLPFKPEGDSALYLKYQEMLKSEIATAFDISPQNLGLERDINRNTAEVAEDRDVAQAIGPWGRKYAGQLTRESIQGLLGFSQLEFRFKGLDRDDEKESAEVFKLEYESNACTPNEYRARKGHPLSDSPWADMVYADMEIAIQAARGAQRIADADVENFNDPTTDPAQYVQKPTKSMGKTSDTIKKTGIKSSEPTRSASQPKRR